MTRAIAFAVDAAIIDLIALLVGVGLGLALSIVSISDNLKTVLLACGGVAFVVWSVTYFAVFWSTTGQTPGNRLMHIRVCDADDGTVLSLRRSVVRFGALVLAALPLFAGFLPVLVDDRRRGLQDMLAGTVVVGVPAEITLRGDAASLALGRKSPRSDEQPQHLGLGDPARSEVP